MRETLLVSRLEVLAAATLFSTGGAAIKAASLTSWQVAGYRSAVAAATLLLLLPAARRNWNWRVLLVGIAYAATLVLFVLANKMTTSASAIFLQATSPLYLLLLGPLLLKERARRVDVLFMALLVAGLALFFIAEQKPQTTAPRPLEGNILGALSGLTYAVTIAGLRWLGRRAPRGDAPISTVAAGNLIAAVFSLAQASGAGAGTGRDWAVIAYLGTCQIALAYFFLTRAVRRVSALEVSMLLLAEPALNPVWSWLAHGENPGAWGIAGGLVIVGATVGMMISKRESG